MHKDTRVFPPTPFQILGCFYCYFGLISVCFAVPAALIHSRFVDMKAASLAWTIFWGKKSYFKDEASFTSKQKNRSLSIKIICVLYFSDILSPYKK